MKTRLDNLEKRLNDHLDEYKKRGELHEKHNLIQAAFSEEINSLNSEIRSQALMIRDQALMIGEHGMTLGNHNKLFDDMRAVWTRIADDMAILQKYVAVAEARLSFKRQLIDNLFKSLPLILFGLGILWKVG